ncbi:prenyl proteinase rce1 [Phlyctema vagabunda]|uniref:intramembrane prenyl-peptidase Rce1 n=1 Tax=Phlyctema vagabunda TaxID=108571 RepID=A0ABR4PL17_9HELO
MAPTSFYDRLRQFYSTPEPKAPEFSTTAAVLVLVVYTLIYVLPFYISATTRPSPQLSRDAPSVIRNRIRSVTASCMLCCISTLLILSTRDDGSPTKAIHQMGYFPLGIQESLQAVALTAILFLGPLFEAGVVEGGWRDWILLRGLDNVGPVTEEVLFRSASVPLLLLSQTSNFTIVFLTPLVFGLAHIHHFYEFRITHPYTPVAGALLRSLLQFTYTTLFGGYATFLYLRGGSLLSVILVHAFCNWLGFPRFWGRVTAGESVIGPDIGEGKRTEDQTSPSHKLSIAWTIIYYVLLFIGAVGWWKLLWPLTESSQALTKF